MKTMIALMLVGAFSFAHAEGETDIIDAVSFTWEVPEEPIPTKGVLYDGNFTSADCLEFWSSSSARGKFCDRLRAASKSNRSKSKAYTLRAGARRYSSDWFPYESLDYCLPSGACFWN